MSFDDSYTVLHPGDTPAPTFDPLNEPLCGFWSQCIPYAAQLLHCGTVPIEGGTSPQVRYNGWNTCHFLSHRRDFPESSAVRCSALRRGRRPILGAGPIRSPHYPFAATIPLKSACEILSTDRRASHLLI